RYRLAKIQIEKNARRTDKLKDALPLAEGVRRMLEQEQKSHRKSRKHFFLALAMAFDRQGSQQSGRGRWNYSSLSWRGPASWSSCCSQFPNAAVWQQLGARNFTS